MHSKILSAKWEPFCLCLNQCIKWPLMIEISSYWCFLMHIQISELGHHLTPLNKIQWNSWQNTMIFFHENAFENVICKLAVIKCCVLNIIHHNYLEVLQLMKVISVLFCNNACIFFVLTHWDENNMADILQTTSLNSFLCMKIVCFLFNFHCNLFLRVQLTILWTALVQIMALHWRGNKQLSEPMTAYFLTNMCIIWPRWVN